MKSRRAAKGGAFAQTPNRLLNYDFSRRRCAGNAPDKDAESANSSAMCATKDDV